MGMSLALLGAYLSDSDSDSDDDEDHEGEGDVDQVEAGQDKAEVRETLANPFLSRGTVSNN